MPRDREAAGDLGSPGTERRLETSDGQGTKVSRDQAAGDRGGREPRWRKGIQVEGAETRRWARWVKVRSRPGCVQPGLVRVDFSTLAAQRRPSRAPAAFFHALKECRLFREAMHFLQGNSLLPFLLSCFPGPHNILLSAG